MAEGPRLIVLNPVLDSRLEESPAGLKLFESLKPGVEAPRL